MEYYRSEVALEGGKRALRLGYRESPDGAWKEVQWSAELPAIDHRQAIRTIYTSFFELVGRAPDPWAWHVWTTFPAERDWALRAFRSYRELKRSGS